MISGVRIDFPAGNIHLLASTVKWRWIEVRFEVEDVGDVVGALAFNL